MNKSATKRKLPGVPMKLPLIRQRMVNRGVKATTEAGHALVRTRVHLNVEISGNLNVEIREWG